MKVRKKLKGILNKTFVICLIIILISSFCCFVFADNADDEALSVIDGGSDVFGSVISKVFSGILGVLLLLPKFTILITAFIIQVVCSILLSATDSSMHVFSPETILFNKVNLLDINFFENNSGLNDSNISAMGVIRQNIANWYSTFTIIASAALLVILAYVAVRMAISTLSQDKAKYKKMLQHWFESFVLLQVLNFIMVIVIYVSNGLVEIFDGMNSTGAEVGAFLGALLKSSLDFSLTGFCSAICYAMYVGITGIFFVIYLKRMLTVGFLVVIAPLITITYSLDKLSDGKSQALNTWLKMFVYNVLIQPFHCVIYLVFVTATFKLTTTSHAAWTFSLAAGVLSIACMAFMLQGEKIIKQIFGFNDGGTLMDGLAAKALVGKAVMPGVKLAQKPAKKFENSMRNVASKPLKSYGNKHADTRRGALATKLGNGNPVSKFISENTASITTDALTFSGLQTIGNLDKTVKKMSDSKDLDKLVNELKKILSEIPKGDEFGKNEEEIVAKAMSLTKKEMLTFRSSSDDNEKRFGNFAMRLNGDLRAAYKKEASNNGKSISDDQALVKIIETFQNK